MEMEEQKDPEQIRKEVFDKYEQTQKEVLLDKNNIYTLRTDHYLLKAALTQGIVVITKEYKTGQLEGVVVSTEELETILLRTKPKTPRNRKL